MKKLLKSLLLLPFLLIVIVVIFIATIDPTRLTPFIQEQLAKQGIDARFKGKTSWQFYPDIGLQITDLELHSLNAGKSGNEQFPMLARLGTVGFSVKLIPLFSREIHINGIRLEDAAVNLYVDKLGQSNWQMPDNQGSEQETRQDNADSPGNDSIPEFDIYTLDLVNLSLVYEDKSSDTRASVENFTLNASKPNIRGEAFPLNISFVAATPDLPTLHFNASSNLGFNASNSSLVLSDLEAHLKPVKGKQSIGESVLRGALSYTPLEKQTEIKTDLRLDRIDLDALLAMFPSEETPAASNTEDTPLPFELLRSLKTDMRFAIDSLLTSGLSVQNVLVKTQSNGGRFTIENLAAEVVDGKIQSSGIFDASQAKANLQLDGEANNIDVGRLLQLFADNNNLAGTSNTQFKVLTQGASVNTLIDNVDVEALTKAQSLVLQPINIQKQYCKLVSLLDKESSAQQLLSSTNWQAFTELQPVEVKVRYNNNLVSMESLGATISNLFASASGEFNLETGKFDFPISLSLKSLGVDKTSCMNINEKWLNRSLPLRCKGSLDKIGIDTCLPDTDLIGDILKNKFKAEADAKLAEEKARLKEKTDAEKARAKEKLEEEKRRSQEKLDEEKRRAEDKAKKKLDDKLKNLVDKL